VLKQLDALPSDPAAAAAIRSVLGEPDATATAEEIAWAVRKLLEERAPVVVVFDDIQWGEETFLDLVEGASLLSSGAPFLIVCIARPELLDRRPQWPVTVRLAPLPAEAVDELIGEVQVDLRDRIARAAGGNPLFLTEMRAMAAEADDVEVPPTLKALLSARLDQLDPPERAVLERGAVEGEIFHRGGVQALAPEDAQVTPRLAALVRRELIRPDRSQLPGDDGFRFGHLLIRDAAYDALPKSTRAELHERFANWLDDRGSDLVELDEIVGYHLEQAARYRRELGTPDSPLADRAAERLAAAGRRALWRDDTRAAASLLERALALTRPRRLDLLLELDLAVALWRPDPLRGAAIADAAAERARESGDRAGEAVARTCAAAHRCVAGASTVEEVDRLAHEALPQLDETRDHAALVHVWFALGSVVANSRGQFEEYAEAAERALHHSRLAGQHPSELFGLEVAVTLGPRPADEALQTLEAFAPPAPHAFLTQSRAWLMAMLGRLDEAWPLALEANERFRELGAGGEHNLGEIARLAGDAGAAADYFGQFCDLLERLGQVAALSTYAPARARVLCSLGELDEAERLARLGRELGAEDDLVTQAYWRQALALVHAYRGEHEAAESLAREAVAIADGMDSPNLQGDAYSDLADVLAVSGRTGEAAAALEQALERYERKKNLAMVAQVRPKLEALRAGATA
jgi:hypothetical protein